MQVQAINATLTTTDENVCGVMQSDIQVISTPCLDNKNAPNEIYMIC